jgi:hypothetical protein
MNHYRVTGRIRGTHECECSLCGRNGDQKSKEFDEIVQADTEDEAITLVLENARDSSYFRDYEDNLKWMGEPAVEEPSPDRVMVMLGEKIAPRLPGF